MLNYQEVRINLTNTKLTKLKYATKNKKGTILRLLKENFEDEELQHESFLTARETIKKCHC